MKTNLLFDFTVDKTTNTVFVNRAFEADLTLVWDAFTKPEILDQWWAPKPWSSKTKYMKFEVGGRRFYAMVSPEGQEHWSIQDFTEISSKMNFKFVSAFTDKDENKNPEFPASNRRGQIRPSTLPAILPAGRKCPMARWFLWRRHW